MDKSTPPVDVDVAVIGCGPTGLALACLLSTAGITVAAVDRYRLQLYHPRATHLDDETMRAFQTLGLEELERSFSSVGKYRFYDRDWRACLEISFDRGLTEQGWRSDYMFHQPDFEAILRGRLGESPNAESFFGWEVTEFAETEERVEVQMREITSGRERTLNAGFVVGADGAGSLVRRTMGCELTDYEASHRSLIVDILPLVDRPADLPDRDPFSQGGVTNPITYVPIAAPLLRFELMLRPQDDAEELERVDHVYEMLSPWFKPDQYRILRDDVYEWRSIVPSPWRRGRMMIAGDAAHTMAPTLGQGMCSGIRDALNLGWKLPRIIRGESPVELLETYESERSPHVGVFVEISARLANEIDHMEPVAPPEGVAPPVKESEVLRPQIGPGVRDDAALAGLLSAQPKLSDGRLLDDEVGFRFAVVGDPDTITAAAEETKELWRALDVAVIDVRHDEVIDWVRSVGASAVVIRPDRYTFGLASTGAELDRLTRLLESQLEGAPMTTGKA
ncbi:MAG: bifunctional 3-(3-hydroxy-phenyl)propionate/3-hydroxycinnamic acid hydroxylase [Solirubrobacterales bacterium]